MTVMSGQPSFAETAELIHAVDAALFDTLKAWMLTVTKEADARAGFSRISSLCAKLAALDPRRALQFASNHPEL